VEERNYECDICFLKFKSNNSLRIHKRRHFNSNKKAVCPICGKEFFSSAALSNHKVGDLNFFILVILKFSFFSLFIQMSNGTSACVGTSSSDWRPISVI
jgi:uncharacterized paraquat-inducible protein A